MSNLIPVSVVCGFLGSGKTTFLNRILHGDHGKKIAILVNEMGEIGVDAAILDTEDSFVQLDNGCICCSLNEDLPITLAEMSKIEGLDHVVIETTGIADPTPVGYAIDMPEAKDLYHLDALICMVDCLNVRSSIEEHDEVGAQISHSDLIILSKCDLVDDAQLSQAVALVNELNPKALLLRGDEPEATVLSLDLKVEKREEILGQSGHVKGFDSLSYYIGRKNTIRFAFEEFLADLPHNIFRAKGIVPLDGERGRLVFHRVGQRLDMTFEENREDDGMLVLIGRELDKDALRMELDNLFEAI